MTGLPALLVIVMATVAVTSAWQLRSLFPREVENVTLDDAPCSRQNIESAYFDCMHNAEVPPLVHTVQGFKVKAEKIVAIMGQVCSVTVPDKVRCMRKWMEDNECPDVDEIVAEAQRTGRFCEGNEPAAWLQDGLLDRMDDITEECFDRDAFGKCFMQDTDTDDTVRLDNFVNCAKTEVEGMCNKVAVLTIFLMNVLQYVAPLGTAPSEEVLLSLKDVV